MITKDKHAEEVRQMWQCRAMAEASGKLQRVLLIAIAKEYPADILVLLKTTFGTVEIPNTFYSDYAAILPNGQIACELTQRENGITWRGFVKVYDNESAFIRDTRRLADQLKLSDEERVDMFRVLKKWVVKDMRVGAEGEKLAS